MEKGVISKTCETDLEDTRNLIDEFKGLSNEEVFRKLAGKRNALEVAIENVSHDFNAGTIVRNANNFNAKRVHIIGRRKYNRRGAMCTDKYLEIVYWDSIDEFIAEQRKMGREIVAIENNVSGVVRADGTEVISLSLTKKKFKESTTLVFGGESDGITEELLVKCDDARQIPSYGSTRSVNVGVASGIAMYEWARQWEK